MAEDTRKNILEVDTVQSIDKTDTVLVNDSNSLKQVSVETLVSSGIPDQYVTESELSGKGYATTVAMNSGLKGKIDKNQGSGNSGKYLSVGSDGNVTLVDAPSSGSEGGITEETDPTVPSWAKNPTKPTYTADEVGALPDDTEIPSKTSDLENDSGFITNSDIPEKLPNPQKIIFTGAVTAEYDGSSQQTINIPTGGGTGGGTTDYNNLSNLPQINDVTLKGNKTLDDIGAQSKIIFDASKNGVRTENNGLQNSQSLQSLIDTVSGNGGGSIYIPSGQYQFSSNGTQNIGEHCIKMKSNVIIFGDGASTILKPTGTVQNGMDMFYWNEYVDSDSPAYLENCIFRDFVIDGSDQHSSNYTSAGKGFMLNLIKNCHWDNVAVKNMDATGFGVDCPIGCTIKNCEAVNNGKQAQTTDVGASGFGIGFGYSYDESMVISDCLAIGNKKFGIFFEHQRRFSEEGYESTTNRGFLVADCIAKQNYYNYGTEQGINVEYSNCISWNAVQHGFFFRNSEECLAKSCTSYVEGDTSYVIFADYTDGGTQENKDNGFFGCVSKYCKYGAKIVNSGSSATMQRNVVKDCFLNLEQTNTIMTSGTMDSLFIEGNVSNGAENNFTATVTDFVDKNNSWNSSGDYTLPIMSSTQLGGGKAVSKTDEDVPVAVDPSTGQLFVPTYPESGSGAGGITVSYDAEQQAIVFTNSSGGGN